MKLPQLTINDSPANFSQQSVHMQNVAGKVSASYCATIPKAHCTTVLDPHRAREESVRWKDFVMEQVTDLGGTSVLSAYFATLAKLTDDDLKGERWMIATLDDVVETSEGVELRGQALACEPSRYGDARSASLAVRSKQLIRSYGPRLLEPSAVFDLPRYVVAVAILQIIGAFLLLPFHLSIRVFGPLLLMAVAWGRLTDRLRVLAIIGWAAYLAISLLAAIIRLWGT